MRIVLSSMLLFSLLIFNVNLAIPQQTEQERIQSVDNGRLELLTNDIKAIKDVINRADRLGLIALIISFGALILGAIGIWYAVGEVKSSAKQRDIGIEGLKTMQKALDIGIESLKKMHKAEKLLKEKREHIETFCSVASESANIISGAMTELKIH